MKNQKLLENAVGAIKKAGDILLRIQRGTKEIKREGKDFLTKADLHSNSIIVSRLRELTPRVPINSEEGDKNLNRTEKEIWIIDPLDGTVNFFHQDVFWGVSVAFVRNRQTELGAIYLPALDVLIGATRDGKIIKRGNFDFGVGKESDLSRAQVWLDWSKESKAVLSILPKIAKVSLYPQIRLCATASLMAVATGKIVAYIHPHPAPEDFSAGYLIVEMAGGKVTDLAGRPCTPFSDSMVASNGKLHNQILEAVNN